MMAVCVMVSVMYVEEGSLGCCHLLAILEAGGVLLAPLPLSLATATATSHIYVA